MIRAAAKNHAHVSVCVDPGDYEALLASLGGNPEGGEARTFRQRMAWKAYQHCASYDTVVAEWLWQQSGAPCFCALAAPAVTGLPLQADSTLTRQHEPLLSLRVRVSGSTAAREKEPVSH